MPHLEHDTKLLSSKTKLSRGRLAIYSGLTALVGVVVVVVIFAATGSLAIEAESGTLAGAAKIATMTGASGGQAVQFGSGATPTPSSTPQAGYPDASNTGVPAGTTLQRVPQDVTSGTGWAWDSRGWVNVTGNPVTMSGLSISGDVNVSGANVTIKNSLIMGEVKQAYPTTGAISIMDSEVNIGTAQVGAIVAVNLTVARSNIHGGQQAIHCDSGCKVTDSFLHGQYNPSGVVAHLGGFLSSGGAHLDIEHNTIQCDAAPNGSGGCSGDLNLFGDFGQVDDVYVYNNFFPGINNYPSYCIYGGSSTAKPYPHATNVRFVNNVVGRGPNGNCGSFGPVAGWEAGNTGNVWSGNKWDDGSALNQ